MSSSASLVDSLTPLEADILRLRASGRSHGLSPSAVDACFLAALPQTSAAARKRKSTRRCAGRCGRCARAVRLFLYVCTALLIAHFVVLMSPWGEEYVVALELSVRRVGMKYDYPVLRLARLLSLPFTNLRARYTELFSSDCMILNPVYKEPDINCSVYNRVTSPVAMNISDIEIYKDRLYLTTHIVRLRDLHRNITMDDLRALYTRDRLARSSLEKGLLRLTTNVPAITSLETLFDIVTDDWARQQPRFHAAWYAGHQHAANVLKGLMSSPYCVGEGESAQEKMIFIDGHEAIYSWPAIDLGFPESRWYVQGSGTRRLIFRPRKECRDVREPIVMTMRPGEFLTYTGPFWEVISAPGVNSTSEINVSYLGFFP